MFATASALYAHGRWVPARLRHHYVVRREKYSSTLSFLNFAATSCGNNPSSSLIVASAPASTSSSTMDKLPVLAASHNGVHPLPSRRSNNKSLAEVRFRRNFTVSLHPQKAAMARGFLPFASLVSTSAPFSSSNSATFGRFLSQDMIRGERPDLFFRLTHVRDIASSSSLALGPSSNSTIDISSSVSRRKVIISSDCEDATATFSGVSPALLAVLSILAFSRRQLSSSSPHFSAARSRHLHAFKLPLDAAARNGASPESFPPSSADSNSPASRNLSTRYSRQSHRS
mmetsp:Transcript_23628/g.50569  ORF Transcript_23628/g.50569 Transcript_23628/m.50569 type:complete len:286 (-) Transcript_23628:296-1153(-)